MFENIYGCLIFPDGMSQCVCVCFPFSCFMQLLICSLGIQTISSLELEKETIIDSVQILFNIHCLVVGARLKRVFNEVYKLNKEG